MGNDPVSKPSYTVATDGQSITCHLCGMTSHNINDVKHHYCGQCNYWHDIGDEDYTKTEVQIIALVNNFAAQLNGKYPDIHFCFLAYRQPPDPKGKQMGLSVASNIESARLLKVLNTLIARLMVEPEKTAWIP